MSDAPYERYLSKPFPGSSHSWAKQAAAACAPASRVLDVGSGSGVMAQSLREVGFTSLFAVETDAATRQQTAHLYTQIAESLDAYQGQQFELVLLLDVLEHMADPLTFLRQLVPLIAPRGRVLISVPNVAHWSVRLPLLLGQFQYRNRGILDRTHLRFFTRNSFRQLLHEVLELEVLSEAVSIPPAEFVLPQAIWDSGWFRAASAARLQAAQLIPGLLGYQLLTVVQKRSSDG
jgi:SAM-dependent methyltransferase